jgi:hypothetical protein
VSVIDADALAAARFVSRSLPKEAWTHAAHLTVGAWRVERHGAAGALERLRTGIRRLNESHGRENTATAGYHETITAAYVALLAAFLAGGPPGLTLNDRIARLLASPLAERDILFRAYSCERLMSTAARAGWIEPDLALLRLATVLSDER